MLAVQVADRATVDFGFNEVADYQIETVQVVSFKRSFAFRRHHDLVAEFAQSLFEQITQLIAIINDEDPAFFHQTPIQMACFEEIQPHERRSHEQLYEKWSCGVRNISERTAEGQYSTAR